MVAITESEFITLIESLPEGDRQAIKETISELRALDFVKDLTFHEVHSVTIEILTDDESMLDRERSAKIYSTEWSLLRKLEGSLGVRISAITDE